MKNRKSFPMGKVLLGAVILATIFTYLHALVLMNGIEPYGGKDGAAIESRVIGGTSMFLQSNADAFLLFSEVESGYGADFDFTKAQELAESALMKLNTSREHYAQVLAMSVAADFENSGIERLRNFDFKGFVTANGLLAEIMERVAFHLREGDISGVLRQNLKNIDEVIIGMKEVQNLLQKEIKPPLESIWSLLQMYSEAILFGNYATLVFYNA